MLNQGRRSVQLSIPAHARMIRFARLTAATLAVDLAFSLEDIEDLRVAVDELSAAVIEGLDDATMLDLRFDIQGEDLVIDGEVQGTGPAPALHPVAEELIQLIVDAYELTARDGSRVFRLVKRRSLDR